MSIFKRQVSSCSNFGSFFIVMTHNYSVNFKLIHFLLWIKGSLESPNFETCECYGEIFLNSCYFSNHQSVFLKILHHSWVTSKITPLHFFRSNDIQFAQKEPIKVQIFETFMCLGQNFSHSSCQFWNDKLILLLILHHSLLSQKVSPL